MGDRADVCWVGVTLGGDLWWLGWVVALWVGAQVGAAGRSTLRACRPDYCAGGADLGLLGWAGSLRVGAPVGAAGRPTLRACRQGFGVGVVELAERGYMCPWGAVLPLHSARRASLPYCACYSRSFPLYFSHDGIKLMGNRRMADRNLRRLVLTVPTRGTSATRATADEQSNRTSRRTAIWRG